MATVGRRPTRSVRFAGERMILNTNIVDDMRVSSVPSCQRGKVQCDPMVCPPTNCSAPIIEEGACCPTCSGPGAGAKEGRGCNFGGDSFFHPAGSRWHPYIPPFGFSRCAICTCKVMMGICVHLHLHRFLLQMSGIMLGCLLFVDIIVGC